VFGDKPEIVENSMDSVTVSIQKALLNQLDKTDFKEHFVHGELQLLQVFYCAIF
jgi:hypothetical protein